jgi:hypothetical protein
VQYRAEDVYIANSPPPAYVDGYMSYCNAGRTVHQIFWMKMIGATTYELFYRLVSDSTFYWFGTVSGGSAPVSHDGVNAYVAVKSCGSAGCSYLSSEQYFMFDSC